MKTLLLVLCLSVSDAFARLEMLIVDRGTLTNSIDVGANEVVNLRKYYEPGTFETGILVQIGQHSILTGCNQCPATALPIKGPAKVALVLRYPNQAESWFAYALLEITPESFPPDKTIVIPEGGQNRVALDFLLSFVRQRASEGG